MPDAHPATLSPDSRAALPGQARADDVADAMPILGAALGLVALGCAWRALRSRRQARSPAQPAPPPRPSTRTGPWAPIGWLELD